MTTKQTSQLQAGDKIRLPYKGLVRTVTSVDPSPYVNHRNEPIVYVHYLEGGTPEWGPANSSIASSVWTVA